MGSIILSPEVFKVALFVCHRVVYLGSQRLCVVYYGVQVRSWWQESGLANKQMYRGCRM